MGKDLFHKDNVKRLLLKAADKDVRMEVSEELNKALEAGEKAPTEEAWVSPLYVDDLAPYVKAHLPKQLVDRLSVKVKQLSVPDDYIVRFVGTRIKDLSQFTKSIKKLAKKIEEVHETYDVVGSLAIVGLRLVDIPPKIGGYMMIAYLALPWKHHDATDPSKSSHPTKRYNLDHGL